MFEKCINCDGKGRVKTLGMEMLCPVCKGLGRLDVPMGKKICSACKGKGGKYTLGGETCKECHGTKFVDKK